MAWKVTVTATLWVMWLSRNWIIFQNTECNISSMVALIKHQTKEWSLAFQLVHKSSISWWNTNPMGSLTSSEKIQVKEIKDNADGLVGFVDGSFKKKGNSIQVGIGGIICKNSSEIIYSFSGASAANISLEAEWNALVFMVKSFAGSQWKGHTLTTYTDCLKLVNNVLEILTSSCFEEGKDLKEIDQFLKIGLKFVRSDLNYEADYLAKKCVKLNSVHQCWVSSPK
ncbi:hypothetical protein ACET3Z_021441 [Daucus carota]